MTPQPESRVQTTQLTTPLGDFLLNLGTFQLSNKQQVKNLVTFPGVRGSFLAFFLVPVHSKYCGKPLSRPKVVTSTWSDFETKICWKNGRGSLRYFQHQRWWGKEQPVGQRLQQEKNNNNTITITNHHIMAVSGQIHFIFNLFEVVKLKQQFILRWKSVSRETVWSTLSLYCYSTAVVWVETVVYTA